MAPWYESSVFYHIYPLGLCGCKRENTGEAESHFAQLRAWADHAKKMNFTGIYIGPLFESVGHGYETTDYKRVDCRLGTNQDFKEYVAYCHSLGIKVIVDGVFNHVGREFFAFRDVKEKREGSPYCGWFCNLNFGGNNEYNDGFSYDNWGGYNLLVKLNQQNPEVQNYLFDVIRFWVAEFDIDGIRLDAADVLDFGFMRAMRQVADEVKPDFWLMGEVIHGDYSRWANDETLHSVTNYELHKGLYSGHNDHNYFEIAHSIKRLNDLCRGRKLYTFLDNHDVERIASKLNNPAHLPLVTILLYTVDGIPSVYYGSEFAIQGKKEKGSDWNLRPCLDLADYQDAYEKNPVTKLCRQLGALKMEYPELTEGRYQELLLTNRQFAFGRVCDTSALVIALNCDDGEAVMDIPCPVDSSGAEELLGTASSLQYDSGRVRVSLPGNAGAVILVGEKVSEKGICEGVPEKEVSEGTASDEKPREDVTSDGGEDAPGMDAPQEQKEQAPVTAVFAGLSILAENPAGLVEFYRSALGFALESQDDSENMIMRRGGIVFQICGRREFERLTCRGYQYAGGVCGHFFIAVETDSEAHLQRLYESAVSLGAQAVTPPGNDGQGRLCRFADPEGNLVEILVRREA